jgi:hypothetical protein
MIEISSAKAKNQKLASGDTLREEQLKDLRALCVVHPLACRLTTLLARGNPIWFTRELGILSFRTFRPNLNRDCMRGITLADLA